MVGRDQYGYIKGPYYMVKPGPMPPGEHNKVESKKLHKLGRFPKLHAAGAQEKPSPYRPHTFGDVHVSPFAPNQRQCRLPEIHAGKPC